MYIRKYSKYSKAGAADEVYWCGSIEAAGEKRSNILVNQHRSNMKKVGWFW